MDASDRTLVWLRLNDLFVDVREDMAQGGVQY